MSSPDKEFPLASSSTGASEPGSQPPSELPVRASMGRVLLPGTSHRLSFSWKFEGPRATGSVTAQSSGQESGFWLGASNPRESLEFEDLPAIVDVWLTRPEPKLHPDLMELHTEVRRKKSEKGTPACIVQWSESQGSGCDKPSPSPGRVEHPVEAVEAFSYLVVQPGPVACCARKPEAFIFQDDPALPPPPPPPPPPASVDPAAPPPQNAPAPAVPPAPVDSRKELIALYPKLFCLENQQELADLTRIAETALGQSLPSYLTSDGARTTSAALWKDVADISARLAGTIADNDSLVLALRVLAFLIRLQGGDERLTTEPSRKVALAAIVVLPEVPASPPPDAEKPDAEKPDTEKPDTEKPDADKPDAAATVPSGSMRVLGVARVRSLHQRLKGYEPGEIAFTLNIMPREKRILSERLRTRSEHESHAGRSQTDVDAKDTDNTSSDDVRNELEKLVGSLQLERDFTDLKETVEPTGLSRTLGGSWKGTDKTDDTSVTRSDTRNVKRAVALARNQLEKRMLRQREERLGEEYERASRAIHDNLGCDTRQVGIYRWLKKLYTLRVVDRGARMVLEFFVPTPATALPSVLGAGEDVPPAPLSPTRFHTPINAYQDVDETNYQVLVAYYHAGAVSPPPDASAPPSAREVWQIQTHDAILAGYRRLYGAWREQYGRWLSESRASPRELEQAALKLQCLKLLQPRDTRPLQARTSPLPFLDEALDWAEMAYRFYPWGAQGVPSGVRLDMRSAEQLTPNLDARFRAFLQAGSARVLVPVAPTYWRAVAFALQYEAFAPWSPGEIPLPGSFAAGGQVLAEARNCRHQGELESWCIEVPTSHIYLGEGSRLPGCAG